MRGCLGFSIVAAVFLIVVVAMILLSGFVSLCDLVLLKVGGWVIR